jgi:hypothetical protein
MVKLPPPTSRKLVEQLRANSAERHKDASSEKRSGSAPTYDGAPKSPARPSPPKRTANAG